MTGEHDTHIEGTSMTSTRDRIYGALIGAAIGDALGAPVEKWDYRDIAATHGKMDRFLPSPAANTGTQYLAADPAPSTPGQFTDDSTARYYLCLSIIESGGRVSPFELARTWLERMNPDRLFYTERIVLMKLKMGLNPWETGLGLPAADNPLMAIAPVGIVNAADPRQAYQDGFAISSMMGAGSDRDAAATLAAGVAAAFSPGATVETVVDAMLANATPLVRRSLDRALAEAERAAGDPGAFTAAFHTELLDWTYPVPPGEVWTPRTFSAASIESLPAAVGLFAVTGGDPLRGVVEGASFGRDCDTIAAAVGSLGLRNRENRNGDQNRAGSQHAMPAE